jgi:hypothetical protein
MSIRLLAKHDSSLLSVEIQRDISPEQLELVKLVLFLTDEGDAADIETLTYSLQLHQLERRSGLEQFQAEDR